MNSYLLLRLQERHKATKSERVSLSKNLALLLEVGDQFLALSREDKARWDTMLLKLNELITSFAYILTLIRAAGGVYDFRNFEEV
jgi:hypothetical protein